MRLKFLLCAAFLSFSTGVFATSTIVTMDHFDELSQLIQNDKTPENTLLAADDDDTLTMMPCTTPSTCQYLGGPAWYDWQSSLPANSPERVSPTITGLIHLNNVIFLLSKMPLVEPSIPDVLNQAKAAGMHIVAATARGDNMMTATFNQFSQDGILNTISSSALPSKEGPYIPAGGTRPIAYENGTLFLSGQNKGTMLQDFLHNSPEGSKIKVIYFIDDSYKNVTDVANAFVNDPNVKVVSIHYTFLAQHKEAFAKGPQAQALQEKATEQWRHIETAIANNLPGFYAQ